MPDNPKPGILTRLRVKRVSLVDNGANQDPLTGDGAHIMLFKSAGPGLAAVHVDAPATDLTDPKKKKELSVAKVITLKSLFKSIAAAISEPDVEKRAAAVAIIEKDVDDAVEMAAPQAAVVPATEDTSQKLSPEHIQTLKAQHGQMDAMCKAFGAGPHPPEHPVHGLIAARDHIGKMIGATPTDEPGALGTTALAKKVETTMDAEVTKKFTDLEKANTDLRTQVAVEKALRLDGEMLAILKSFKASPFVLTGEKSDVAKFRKMKEDTPELWDRTLEILKAQDAIASQSLAFSKQIGSGLTGTGSAWDQIDAKAESMVEKGAGKITKEQALEKVMLDNPKLVAQYREEQM